MLTRNCENIQNEGIAAGFSRCASQLYFTVSSPHDILSESKTILAESNLILRASIIFCESEQGSGKTTCPLSPCASDRPAWFGHAPGVEQFGEPLFREDFLFFGHLAHGLA